jgi:hypothetical protein
MAGEKDWRTVVKGDSTGRFTREQIRDAVDSVASKSPSTRSNSPGKNGGATVGNSGGGGANRGEKPSNGPGKRS